MENTNERSYNYKIKEKKKKLSKEEKLAIKIQERTNLGLNQIIKPIVFLVLSIVMEFVNFYILNITTETGTKQVFPTYIFFDIGFWLIIATLILISSKRWLSNTLFYVFLFAEILLCAVNSSLYKDFGYFFTWDMIALALEGLDSFDMSFIDIGSAIMYLSLIAVFIALPLLIDFFGKKKQFKLNKMSKPILMLICFLSLFTLGSTSYGVQIATLKSADNEAYAAIESDKFLYSHMHINEEALRKFGICGFYTKNLYDLTLGKLFTGNQEEYTQLINSQTVAVNEDAVLYGDNLIVVMMESYEWFAIDPYNTPNLWKLKTGTANEGSTSSIPGKCVVVYGYHSNNKTNVSENSAILGYMPHINQIRFGKENTLATAYSLPNLFNNLGYTANYFHNFVPTFYDRDTVNLHMGFDNFYNLNDFESDNKGTYFEDFNLDEDFASQLMNKIAPTDKKFMSFFTTITTHGSYSGTNERLEKHYQTYDANKSKYILWLNENGYTYPSDKTYQAYLRHYKSAAMDTDAMIGKLFEHLQNTGLINNTTVVLYSDHNAYYHNLSQKVKGTEIEDIGNLTTHNVPLMIYSSKLGTQYIYDFCNNFDLYPTICELFGLGYSEFFTQGYNILSEDIANSLYVSHLTGYYNSKCYSKTMKNISLYEGATKANIDTFKKNVCKFYNKQILIEDVYNSGWKVK